MGAEIKEGDILIGKITPKGETVVSRRKLFERYLEIKQECYDASLKAGPSLRGVVIEKLFQELKIVS